jgi:predicted nucleic acid-binding protein
MSSYLLDTNVLSDLTRGEATVLNRLRIHRADTVYLCQPVYFESLRGLLWKNAPAKLKSLEALRKLLTWVELIDEDWTQAATMWANTQHEGKQLADVDLLVAALTLRLDAILVSADEDFDALSVARVNWRSTGN